MITRTLLTAGLFFTAAINAAISVKNMELMPGALSFVLITLGVQRVQSK